MDKLASAIERITFYNPKNDYTRAAFVPGSAWASLSANYELIMFD